MYSRNTLYLRYKRENNHLLIVFADVVQNMKENINILQDGLTVRMMRGQFIWFAPATQRMGIIEY
jgi:hypothetical protein